MTLRNFDFIALNIIGFLTFCNNVIFYNLYNYLLSLGFSSDTAGLLLAAMSLSSMILNLVLCPLLTPKNAPSFMLAGSIILFFSVLSYLFCTSFAALFALRLFHGMGFIILLTATMARLVVVIPPDQSGRAFSVYTISTLLPYGLVPLILDHVAKFFPNQAYVYAAFSPLLLVAVALIVNLMRRQLVVDPLQLEKHSFLLPFKDIWSNIRQITVLVILLVYACLFIGFTIIMFFLKSFAQTIHLADIGGFFLCLTITIIAIRLVGSQVFDRVNKIALIIASFGLMALAFLGLSRLSNLIHLYLISLLFGVGMGIGVPVISALMFQISEPRLRGLNQNLLMFMLQVAFFLGPLGGGIILGRWHYSGLFMTCAVLNFGAALFLAVLFKIHFQSQDGR
jgi:predicted MFS family arabinose efflux permease